MQKIKVTSRVFSIFFLLLSVIIPLITAYLILFNFDLTIQIGFWSTIIPSMQRVDFSFAHRVIVLLIEALPLSVTVLIYHHLSKLFGLYERGFLFEQANIRLIKKIGILMIAGEGIALFFQPMMSVALTFNNPVGERVISIALGATNATTLVTGFIILVASWVVQEAHQLSADAQLTI